MAHRSLRASFVITTVATVSLAACGGETGDGASGTGATGSGATGGAGGYGGAAGGTAGVVVDAGACPPNLPYPNAPCQPEGLSCGYAFDCQSGPITISSVCTTSGSWALTTPACSHPYDSCPGTDLYCDYKWKNSFPRSNPPPPCPNTLPAEGSSCFNGPTQYIHEYCGYPCASTGQWVVARCPYEDDGQSSWSYDQACP